MGGPWMACTYGTGYGHHWAPKHGPFHQGSERILTPFASMRMLACPMKVTRMIGDDLSKLLGVDAVLGQHIVERWPTDVERARSPADIASAPHQGIDEEPPLA